MILTIGSIIRISENNKEEAGQVGIIRDYDEKTDEYLIKPGRYDAECIRVRSMNIQPLMKKASLADDPLDATPKHHYSEAELLHILDPGSGKETVLPAEKEAVNHPDHYQGPHECIEVMKAAFGKEAVKHFCACNAFKYRFRAGMKNGEEDIKKAEWYEEYLIKMGGIGNDTK